MGSRLRFELPSSDQEGAKTFCARRFGWQAEDSPMTAQPSLYTLFSQDGDEVAAA